MDISNPEVVVRRRYVLEGYVDFSKHLATWDINKNILRKSSEMFVYCHEKRAVVCPAPKRRGMKEDGFVIAYNNGYIIGVGENEETCIENMGWIRKKFRHHDPNLPLRVKLINFIIRIDIPRRVGMINLFKLYNKMTNSLNNIYGGTLYSRQLEVLFDPELYSAVIINFQKMNDSDYCHTNNSEGGREGENRNQSIHDVEGYNLNSSENNNNSDNDSKKNFVLKFPDEMNKEAVNYDKMVMSECCFIVSCSSVIVQKVKEYGLAVEAFQILMRYINRNDLLVNVND